MANIWSMSMRGFTLSNSTPQRNVSFIQPGFSHVSVGHAHKLAQIRGAKQEIFRKGVEPNMAEKTASILIRKPKPASGGIIEMFSTVQPATESVKGPPKPPRDPGTPPQHDNQPGKGPKRAAEDTGSGSKNTSENPRSKK